MTCTQCGLGLQPAVSAYSNNEFGYELCLEHQHWFRNLATATKLSKEAADLYFALKDKGLEVNLQKCDDSKNVDISLPDARINIQVDGAHTNDYYQALDNLKTSQDAFQKGYMTFRLPATLVRQHLDDATGHIADLLQQHSSAAWQTESYMAQTM